jgi:hypothetical protein
MAHGKTHAGIEAALHPPSSTVEKQANPISTTFDWP